MKLQNNIIILLYKKIFIKFKNMCDFLSNKEFLLIFIPNKIHFSL